MKKNILIIIGLIAIAFVFGSSQLLFQSNGDSLYRITLPENQNEYVALFGNQDSDGQLVRIQVRIDNIEVINYMKGVQIPTTSCSGSACGTYNYPQAYQVTQCGDVPYSVIVTMTWGVKLAESGTYHVNCLGGLNPVTEATAPVNPVSAWFNPSTAKVFTGSGNGLQVTDFFKGIIDKFINFFK